MEKYLIKKLKKESEKEEKKIIDLGYNSYIEQYEEIPKTIQVSEKLFKELWDLRPKEKGSVNMRGKTFIVNRSFQSYGKPYYFSNEAHEALPIEHPYLIELRKWVCEHSGFDYDQILINWYPDGTAGIGHHSDSEKQLQKGSAIYSFSFGETREFVVKAKKEMDFNNLKISMKNNSLLIMGGEMQKYFTHSVPKCTKTHISNDSCSHFGPRINITFRLFQR